MVAENVAEIVAVVVLVGWVLIVAYALDWDG